MSTDYLRICLLLVLNIGHEVLGVNLYIAENPLTTDSLEFQVVNRFKRDATSPFMPDYYLIKMNFRGKLVNATLKRQDVILDLSDRQHVYKRDWATYTSDEVDGVFVVHRHKPTRTGLTIEGYMMHDMTPYLVQPQKTLSGHVIHQLGRRSTSYTSHSSPFLRRLKNPRRRDASLLDGRDLNMKAKFYADVAMREFVRSRVDETEVDSVIQEYYAMIVNFINRRFGQLRTNGLHIYLQGMGLEILTSPIPGVVESVPLSNYPEGKSTCSKNLMDKFVQFTQSELYDQVILLTGYNLLSPDGVRVTRLGTKDNGCKEPGARSIVQFGFSEVTFRRAAHAVMKGFGVKNDGERGDPLAEECASSSGYIMSESDHGYFSSPYLRKGNWWLYSTCTRKMLRRYLANLDKDRSRICLRAVYNFKKKISSYGFRKTLDQQCHFFAGPRSYASKGSFNLPNICTDGLTCLTPVLNGRKLRIIEKIYLPLPGTPCAEKMTGYICRRPRYVYSSQWNAEKAFIEHLHHIHIMEKAPTEPHFKSYLDLRGHIDVCIEKTCAHQPKRFTNTFPEPGTSRG